MLRQRSTHLIPIRSRAIAVLAGTLLALGAARGVSDAAELTNGGFEDAGAKDMPVGWQPGKHFGKLSPGATFSVDAANAQEGAKSLKITSKDATIPAIIQSAPVDIEEGASYTLTAQIKADTKASMRMMAVPSDFKNVSQSSIAVTNEWKQYELAVKPRGAGVMPVNLRFDLMEPGTVWIDHVTFTKTKPGTGVMSDAAALTPKPVTQVNDGSFEQTAAGALPEGWSIGKHYDKLATGATFVVDETVAHTGKYSLKVTSPTDEGIPAITLSSPVNVEPEEAYVVTAYMRSDKPGASAQLMALRTDYKGADRAPIVLTDQWREYRLVFKATKGAPGYFARFDAGQGTLWIDDVSITKLTDAAAAYKPGPALGYRYGETAGDPAITLNVGAPTGKTFANINGVCYHRGFGAKSLSTKFADTKLKVVRLHNVLSHQKILQKQPDGSFTYDYTLLDKSIDEILAIGAVPQISLCFVPPEMVDNPDPAKIRDKFYLGQPSDYGKWEAYIFDVVKHCTEKYPNVNDWYWIFGNEPGVRQFSMGTQEEFYTLYKHTLAAAVRANPKITIGAGSFAHFSWLKDFVQRCGAEGTRVDLISFHHYDIVPGDYASKIEDVKNVVAKFPNTANAKLAIDEWNSILPDARPAEYSAGNYAAAHATASIYTMMKSGLSYQTHFIASSPHGWGMLGSKDVKSPVFNAFHLMAMMGSQELAFSVPENEPYVGGYATRSEDGTVSVLLWYAKSKNDISPNTNKAVTIALAGIAPSRGAKRYVIDASHSNALSDPKREELESVAASLKPAGNGAEVQFEMPANSVSLLVIQKP